MIRIVESKYITSAVKATGYPSTIYPDFAFVGRSNVGKSSMINTLTNRKLLAKIANRPGKTRLINFFECRTAMDNGQCTMDNNAPSAKELSQPPAINTESNLLENRDNQQSLSIVNCQLSIGLVDLPGYGFAKVSKTERDLWRKMINEFFLSRKQLAGVIVLVDIRHSPDPKDAMMIDMLKSLGINFMVAATKSDKIPKGKIPAALKTLRAGFELGERFICEFSSQTKAGQDKILNWIETYLKSYVLDSKVIVH